MNTKKIPIGEARQISEKYGQSHVVIVTWDRENNRTHVVTYGATVDDCRAAAEGGNFVKKALGWPEKLCHAKPKRGDKKP